METCKSSDLCEGAAWLSSARAVRCRLKCHNERNPRRQLLTVKAEDSGGTAIVRCEEGGDDVNQHGPYVRGYTRVTMGGTEGSYLATGC